MTFCRCQGRPAAKVMASHRRPTVRTCVRCNRHWRWPGLVVGELNRNTTQGVDGVVGIGSSSVQQTTPLASVVVASTTLITPWTLIFYVCSVRSLCHAIGVDGMTMPLMLLASNGADRWVVTSSATLATRQRSRRCLACCWRCLMASGVPTRTVVGGVDGVDRCLPVAKLEQSFKGGQTAKGQIQTMQNCKC